ncbi:MAG: hypothetical protein ACLR4C_02525 [Eubacterium ventriosum]
MRTAGQTITDLGLSEPSDMVIDENNIAYIVDTGNQKIVVYDLNTEKVVKEMKKGTINSDEFTGFETPKGIFRTNEGELYIADSRCQNSIQIYEGF